MPHGRGNSLEDHIALYSSIGRVWMAWVGSMLMVQLYMRNVRLLRSTDSICIQSVGNM